MRREGLGQKLGLVVFGLCMGLVLLEGLLRLGGAAVLVFRDIGNRSGLRTGQYRIMCIGGSTTARGGGDSYPSQLEKILKLAGTGIDFKVINAGVDGQDSRGVLMGLEANLRRWRPDMVVAIVGNNDGEEFLPYGCEQEKTLAPAPEASWEKLRTVKLWRLLAGRLGHKFAQAGWSAPQAEKTVSTDMDIDPAEFGLSPSHEGDEPPEIKEKIKLGLRRNTQQRYEKARGLFAQVLAEFPDSRAALNGCAQSLFRLGDSPGAQKLMDRLVALDPENAENYFLYALRIEDYYKSEKALEMLRKAVFLAPERVSYYYHLCNVLRALGRKGKAADVLANAISHKLAHHVLFGYAATCMFEQGRLDEAGRYYKMAHAWRLKYFNPKTRYNYPRICDMVVRFGAVMVCAQDPMVGLEPLMKVLDFRNDVVFVDNSEAFRNALTWNSYPELFTDCFGGEFGHATSRGNRVLARSIAGDIMEKCFGVLLPEIND